MTVRSGIGPVGKAGSVPGAAVAADHLSLPFMLGILTVTNAAGVRGSVDCKSLVTKNNKRLCEPAD